MFQQKAVEPRDDLVVLRPPIQWSNFREKIARFTKGAMSIFVQLRAVRKNVIQDSFCHGCTVINTSVIYTVINTVI